MSCRCFVVFFCKRQKIEAGNGSRNNLFHGPSQIKCNYNWTKICVDVLLGKKKSVVVVCYLEWNPSHAWLWLTKKIFKPHAVYWSVCAGEAERKRTEHLDLAGSQSPKPKEHAVSPESKKKAKGIRRFFGMWDFIILFAYLTQLKSQLFLPTSLSFFFSKDEEEPIYFAEPWRCSRFWVQERRP